MKQLLNGLALAHRQTFEVIRRIVLSLPQKAVEADFQHHARRFAQA
jgi:hypothetical protein